MNLSLYIARRYLFSPKSHRVINIISGVAIAGVTLATAAMICTLSVFNGFKELVAMQFTAFDPTIEITSATGSVIDTSDKRLADLSATPHIETISYSLEGKAMVQYRGRQTMVTLKGVEDNFAELTDIENALVGNGQFILRDSMFHYATPGIGLVSTLNSGIYFTEPLEIYCPRRGRKVNITNPGANFKKGHLYASGKAFIVNRPEYDDNSLLTSLDFARDVLGRSDTEVGSIGLRIADNADVATVKNSISKALGSDYKVNDRYEQQAELFRIMEIEKFISYIFLSFILLIACFNIIGSLSMLIIDKKQDMKTLHCMGASNRTVTRIFVFEGWLVSAIGAIAGLILGVAVCLLQEHLGLLTFGDGNFIVESYPVKVEVYDILATFGTVLLVGIIAVGIPVRLLTKGLLKSEITIN